MQRWRGLRALVTDAVEHGSRAVERVQRETARRPFDILEKIPAIRVPVRGVRMIHDTSLSGVHGIIRLVNRAVGVTLEVVIDIVDDDDHEHEAAPPDGAERMATHGGTATPARRDGPSEGEARALR